MSKKGFDITAFVIAVVGLLVGAMIGPLITGYLPISDASVEILVCAMIQALILGILGVLSGKLTLGYLIIVSSVLITGSVIASFVGSFVGFTGYINTFFLLAIQVAVLALAGLLGKAKISL